MARYTLDQKINALNHIATGNLTLTEAEADLGIPASTLGNWRQQEATLRRTYRQHQTQRTTQTLFQVQQKLAEKALQVVDAMTDDTLESASLSQLSSALNALIGRFLNLQDNHEILLEQTASEKVFRIEYYDATTGRVSDKPPWAGQPDDPITGQAGEAARSSGADSEDSLSSESAVRGGGLRQTLRQNADGTDSHQRDGDTGSSYLVAGSDIPDGRPGLAGFESDPHSDGHSRYHD
jgi:transposase-like protein